MVLGSEVIWNIYYITGTFQYVCGEEARGKYDQSGGMPQQIYR